MKELNYMFGSLVFLSCLFLWTVAQDPTTCSSFKDWEGKNILPVTYVLRHDVIDYLVDYISTWQRRYSKEAKKMYPFGDWFCDTNATAGQKQSGFNPDITKTVYYAGMKHRTLWVRENIPKMIVYTLNLETLTF